MASDTAWSIRMKYRRRLRSRIIFFFVLYGIVLTGLYSVATWMLRAELEDRLIGNQIERENIAFLELFRKDPTQPGQPFSRIEGVLFGPNKFANVPFAWRDLPNGVHDLSERLPNGELREYKLAVQKDPDVWAFLSYDLSDQRRLKQQLAIALIVATVVFSGIALLLGVWSASRIMSPVTDLARRLGQNVRGGQHEPLAKAFADDEIGQLAAALDGFAERRAELVERTREFNNDVSHELRTPLAVVRTATELMLSQTDLSDRTRQRLQRIERAAQQCTDLTTALLYLSRQERVPMAPGEACALDQLVPQIIDAQKPLLGRKPVQVSSDLSVPFDVLAPDAVVSVALSNLIGNAFKYTPSGEVLVRVSYPSVTVADSGSGIPEDELEHIFDRHYRGRSATGKGAGLGLAIVLRLCDLYGWQVRVAPRNGGGLEAVLDFAGTALRRALPADSENSE